MGKVGTVCEEVLRSEIVSLHFGNDGLTYKRVIRSNRYSFSF